MGARRPAGPSMVSGRRCSSCAAAAAVERRGRGRAAAACGGAPVVDVGRREVRRHAVEVHVGAGERRAAVEQVEQLPSTRPGARAATIGPSLRAVMAARWSRVGGPAVQVGPVGVAVAACVPRRHRHPPSASIRANTSKVRGEVEAAVHHADQRGVGVTPLVDGQAEAAAVGAAGAVGWPGPGIACASRSSSLHAAASLGQAPRGGPGRDPARAPGRRSSCP